MNDQNKWRKFEDEKPEHGQNVWVFPGNFSASVGLCICWQKNSVVSHYTHWLPAEIPAPPEPEKSKARLFAEARALEIAQSQFARNCTDDYIYQLEKAYLAGAASK